MDAVERTEAAAAAWRRGEALAAEGDLAAALAWLDRARRLTQGEEDAGAPTLDLLIATLHLQSGSPEAVARFAALAARHDRREIWLGLAAAAAREGARKTAADALARAFARHAGVLDAALCRMADGIARAAGRPGWCAVDEAGRLRLGALAGKVTARLDGWAHEFADGLMLPARARALALRAGGRALLGSPLDLAAQRRIEGVVSVAEGGIAGWVWHPGDAAADPWLQINPARGQNGFRWRAACPVPLLPPGEVLVRPRLIDIPAARLAGLAGPLHVRGPDGADLPGSPLDPAGLPPAPAARRMRRRRRERPLAVVIPAYRDRAMTLDCIARVRATIPPGTAVVVIDDASPEPALSAALRGLAAAGDIRLLRHATRRGFPASANAGLRAVGECDAVLLNSDALVAAGWLERLRTVAYAAADIGSVTPFANEGSILSYPECAGGNPLPDAPALHRLAALAWETHGAASIEIPVGVGFCLFLRRDCLREAGPLRTDVFAQGYGEEVDVCLRARALGWRHVAAPGVFVGHRGGGSFGPVAAALQARNLAVLEQLHPGYAAMIAAYLAADPLAEARRALDAARFLAAACRPARLLITHDRGGGVARQVAARIARLRARGQRAILLRPLPREAGETARGCVVEAAEGFPNLRYRLPAEGPALLRLLEGGRIEAVELHHRLGHHPEVLDLCQRLGVPYEVHVHDYAAFCPRIALLGPARRYCGEPDVAGCEACVAVAGSELEETIGPAALIARSTADFAGAARVIVPSRDAARRLARHFPGLRPRVRPWENEPPAPIPPSAGGGVVCVAGAIGLEKGFEVLLACARDAAHRALPLRFVLVGYSIDDEALLRTGRVFVTGPYREAEAVGLIARQGARLALLPSIWPETWCFALSALWRAGLFVAAFDIGAPAERIRARGGGMLLPLGLDAASVNARLLGW